jgi:hypothetical protein
LRGATYCSGVQSGGKLLRHQAGGILDLVLAIHEVMTGRKFVSKLIGSHPYRPREVPGNAIPGNFPGRGTLGELTYNPTFQAICSFAVRLAGEAAMMSERELHAEIVKSGTWLYDEQVPSEVWIVKQDFEYHYEEDFSDGPEQLNSEGEAYQVVIARNGEMIGLGPARLSLADAVSAAEEVITTGVVWTNHVLQRLYGGRYYCTTPTQKDVRA